MNPDELRNGFLNFFADRGHEICKSDLLLPQNDPTLLFTSAGMNQFKEMFLGIGNLPYRKAASCQKCMRMPDLENVGRTASHHTFFEMLGNFSFGDYFKSEAIAWSIEYLVGFLGLDFKDLRVSVYENDDESAEIWQKEVNVPADRIYRFGEKDNFWPSEAPSKGPNGVCGPCSEIYIDLKGGCGTAGCNPSCDCGRYVEIWNLVFTQFLRKDGGVLEPLPFNNIDTGMGFERLLRVLEGASTNFDTSLFFPIIRRICELSGSEYGKDSLDDVRMRRIADHLRAALFGILDGAPPSNEKQGYVIRKVLRRAIMDGRNLGLEGSFLCELIEPVKEIMGNAYPELKEQKTRLEREIALEEQRFHETYQQGSNRLSVFMDDLAGKGKKVLPGKSAFLLYDTFGFPVDLAERILVENGFSLDMPGFENEMEAQRVRARRGSDISDNIFDPGPLGAVKADTPPTVFAGYDTMFSKCRILRILGEDGLLSSIHEGESASLVLDTTPFYAEAGGQTGDVGVIRSGAFTFTVNRGTARDGDYYLHTGKLEQGTIKAGDTAEALVDVQIRNSVQRNHTATHLLHFALREVLGKHVEQAGSLVEEARLRFDFLHPSALEQEEIRAVQAMVNEMIRSNLRVSACVKSMDAAKKEGAVALFGEKYEESVRVVTIGDADADKCSKELCGGTHTGFTGEIGVFMILSEESIAAGTRRIEAATGEAMNRSSTIKCRA